MARTKRNKMLSVRASDEEIARVKNLAAELMGTHRYLKKADVLRELIGFENTGLITAEMRKRLLDPPGDSARDERAERLRETEDQQQWADMPHHKIFTGGGE